MDTYPDIEGGLRTYLRAQTAISSLVSQRVYFGIPASPTYPLITISAVGPGVIDESDAPVLQSLVDVSVWGVLYADANPARLGGDKAGTNAISRVVLAVLRNITSATELDDDTVAYGCVVGQPTYRPDPESDRPRYILTPSITSRTGSLISP